MIGSPLHPESVTGVAAPARRSRNQAIEALRIVAAYGIVAYHSGAVRQNLVYAGLIVFLVLSPLMDVRYHWIKRRPARALARTLLLPWLVWMGVYAVVNAASHAPVLPAGNPLSGLLMGTAVHLWFLPFLFAVLMVLNLLKARVGPAVLFWTGAVGAALVLVTAPAWRALSLGWPLPLPQWMHALAPVLIGVTIGLAPRIGRPAWVGAAVVAAGLAGAVLAGLQGLSIPYLVGVTATALAVALPVRLWPRGIEVQPVSACMMGVYLSHILVLGVLSPLTGSGTYTTVSLTFAVTLAGVYLARRFLPGARAVLG